MKMKKLQNLTKKLSKLFQKLMIAISLITLTACAGTTCKGNFEYVAMPEFPIAGKKVANEIDQVCNDADCAELNDYMNRIYKFKKAYSLMQKAANG